METEDGQGLVPPELVLYTGDWDEYRERLYQIYLNTLGRGNLTFRGLRVSLQRRPEYEEKPFAFWHLITEGEKEEERTPDFRRCEKLPWVKWVIEMCDSNPNDMSSWENERFGERRVVIWYETENYAVILGKRNGYYILKSAYPLTSHRAETFRRERDEYLDNQGGIDPQV